MVEDAQRLGPADVEVNGPWTVAIDAAHMGDDESTITKRRGLLTLPRCICGRSTARNSPPRVEDECRTLEDAGGTIGSIVIELDGPGVSCYDTLKRGKYKDLVLGVHTGARLQDDRNYNVRARMWRAALDYLKAGGCAMPVDAELKSQLSSLRYKYQGGLLLMESKKEYKSRLSKSPDRADSWVLSYCP